MDTKMKMVKGTLDVLVLKSLSWGPMHGYSVSRWIRQVTDGALQIEEGALYPSLHRMERRDWLEAEWGLIVELSFIVSPTRGGNNFTRKRRAGHVSQKRWQRF